MFTKAQNKYIRSLTQQKYRKEYNVFVAEGVKIVHEWLTYGDNVQMIVATEDWIASNDKLISRHPGAEVYTVKPHELESVSSLQTPNQVLLVIKQPSQPDIKTIDNCWCIALDDIRDPGNMGTIIRIADWFGIEHIVTSEECVDIYNPKVVQAAMGSHLRMNFYTADLAEFISNSDLPALAATLEGEDVYDFPSIHTGIILIGNESKGVSQSLINLAKHKITIPRKGGAESLNAAVSTGILCALLVGGR